MMLLMGLPNGRKVPVEVASVDKKCVRLDLNHPLAGKALNFSIKIAEINRK